MPKNKLQKLTEKIYNEGIDDANKKADEILSRAKQKAAEIEKEAQQKASEIVKSAEQKAEEHKKNVDTEIKLAARQSISAIKQQITSLIASKIISEPVDEALKDKDFIQNIIQTTIKNWNPQNSEGVDLAVLLPESHRDDLWSYFKTKISDVLNSNLTIEYDSNLKSGYKIGPQDGSFKINFSDNDFQNFFKTYLRPRIVKYLYEGE